MKKALLLLVTLTAAVAITACGGGGGTPAPTGPTIVSFVTADGLVTLIPDVAADVSEENTSFTVIFSTNMDVTTLTSANISISCVVAGVGTMTATPPVVGTTYTITPSGITPTEGDQCTIVFGTEVKAADLTPLAATVTYIANVVSQADFEKAAKAAKIAAGGAEMIAKFIKVCGADGEFALAFTDASGKIAQCGTTISGPCNGPAFYEGSQPGLGSVTVGSCTYTGTCVPTVIVPAVISPATGGTCTTTITDYELAGFTVGATTYTPTLNVTLDDLTAALGSGEAHISQVTPNTIVNEATFSEPAGTVTGTELTVSIDDGSNPAYEGTLASNGSVVMTYAYVPSVSATFTAIYTASSTSTVVYAGDTFTCTGVGGTLVSVDHAEDVFTPASISCVK